MATQPSRTSHVIQIQPAVAPEVKHSRYQRQQHGQPQRDLGEGRDPGFDCHLRPVAPLVVAILDQQGENRHDLRNGLVLAIAFRREHDWWSVAADCQRLAQETASRLGALTGLRPFSSPQFCAPQMVAMPIPPCDPAALHEALIERYNIEIPVFEWQGHHVVRLSCQGYNTREQMTVLIDALTDLLALEAPRARANQS